MANARTDAIIDAWKSKAGLTLSAEEEQKLKAWFAGAAERIQARREAGKNLFVELAAAVESNDSAKADELLKKLREGFRQLSEGREKALDEFDSILSADQRARIVVAAVKQAKESGRPVEHIIDQLFSESN
ncbi:unnamed protein product [Adineta ricciae]|uniref:Uncharacterized protein n=1 Tax=Adineta ricciae TaxID=249248 RepID=A0A814K6V9_ADIRI|nr:unnamed protein product [Adineta ricciae]